MKIEITSAEAELLIFALALRFKQIETRSPYQRAEAKQLADRIEQAGMEQEGWDKNMPNRFDSCLHPMKRVTLTCYETNPNPVPQRRP